MPCNELILITNFFKEISRKTRSKGAASIENSCESSSQLSQEMVTTGNELQSLFL